ncbi:MAG: pentapeptide repeat-containing protein [Chloroflexi bacterium]|nr:pentapeptide repeat-containing protein [Chloroflexota bacterium]
MPLPIIVGLALLLLLLVASNYLAPTRKTIARRIVIYVLSVALCSVGGFLAFYYWTIHSISCSPICIGANLIGRDLQGANLRNSNFMEANLRGANLSGADLYNVNFSGANLNGVNLQNANLQGARFAGASLVKADLRGVQLSDADLSGADLSETDFTQADLTRTHLKGVIFAKAKLVEVDLRGKNLAGVIFTLADLTSANLNNTDLSGSRLSGANLSGTHLSGANLAGSWLNLTNLTGADLSNANLAGANLIGANLASANLSGSRLADAALIGAHVNGADVRSADLGGVRLLADQLTPIDLLTDPLLLQLNDLQLSQVIADVDLSGVSFNRQTKWPIGNTSALADMLGQKFFNEMRPAANGPAGQLMPIRLTGSATVMPLTQTIFTLFVQDGYTQTIAVDTINTDAAFKLLCETDDADIIMTQRLIMKTEADSCATHGRIPISLTVGLQALTIVANPANKFFGDVTLPVLNRIAVADRWSDVNLDWPREKISRYVPDLGSVSFRFWAERIFGANMVAVQQAPRTIPSANSAQLVQGVINDPYALGVLDFAVYKENAGALKLISINGIMPTSETVSNGVYTLAQPLYLYVDAVKLRKAPQIQDFLNFYLDHMNGLVLQVGLFPTSPGVLDQAKKHLNAPPSSRATKD